MPVAKEPAPIAAPLSAPMILTETPPNNEHILPRETQTTIQSGRVVRRPS